MKLKDYTRFVAVPARSLTALVCCLIIVIVLQGIAAAIVDVFRQTHAMTEAPLPIPTTDPFLVSQADKRFLPDGSIHLQYLKNAPVRLPNQTKPEDQEVRITDTRDKVLFEGKRKDIPFTYIEWAHRFDGTTDTHLRQEIETIGVDFSKSLRVPVIAGVDRYGRSAFHQYWRYDAARRVFVGYDWGDGERYVAGTNGVHDRTDQVVPFEALDQFTSWREPSSGSPLFLWLTRSRLYQIDFQQPSIQVLLETEGRTVTPLYALNWRGFYPSKGDPLLALRTADGGWQVLWGQNGRKVRIGPTTIAALSYPFVGLGAANGKLFLRSHETEWGNRTRQDADYAHWLQQYRKRPYQSWMQLYEVSDSGQVTFVSRFEWTTPPWPDYPEEGQNESGMSSICGGHLLNSSPPVYALAWHFIVPRFETLNMEYSFLPFVLGNLLRSLHPVSWGVSLAISLVLAALALWHGWARRTSWWSLALWLVLVGAFGLAGLLTYLGLNHTPVIRCPACGRKRNLQRSACPACNASLPAPPPREVDLLRPV